MTTIELPTGAVHTRKTITDCEWKIRTFVERDAYVAYDYWITTRDLPTDRMAREHLYVINNAMRARAGIAPWQALFGARLEQLARIPLDLDLITSRDDEVEEGLRQLAQI